jgi:glycine zipper 2TM protein
MRKMILALSAATLTIPALPAAPAFAHDNRVHHARTWRGADGRIYCRKPNGTTGLIVGGTAGVLTGRQVDKHGDRTTGTILGAALGALLGRHVQRNLVSRCR